jgi:hypothetical protein
LEIPAALWDDLVPFEPKEVSLKSGAILKTENIYELKFLNQTYMIDPNKRIISPASNSSPLGFQKSLVILTYLTGAAKGPAPGLSGKQVSGWEIPGGSLFFRGPHELSTEPLVQTYRQDTSLLVQKALNMGAKLSPPALFGWLVLPLVEIEVYLETEDDEFPAAARYTFDSHIHYYLPLDAIWALINIVALELSLK